jgi:class 3 adenylate cyclase
MKFTIREKLINRLLGKIPLRVILILPFVLTIFATVVTVGYLSLKNGQEAVKEVTTKLLDEITSKVEHTLPSYLSIPDKVNRINALAIEMGSLDLSNIASLENYFWRQVTIFDTIGFIGLGLENKDDIGAERLRNDLLTIRSSSKASNYIFTTVEVNEKGEKGKVLDRIPYDPRKRPWYKSAVKAGKGVWSEIYPNTAGVTSYLGMSQPFYDKNKKLQGVLISNLNLILIGDFLESLKIGKTGQVFIIERNGLLVATSTGEKPFVKVKKDYGAVRIKASQTKNTLTKLTAKYLEENADKINLADSSHLEIKINNQLQFVVVKPYKDKYGLDWLITVVIPAHDFMDKINENTSYTIILCVVAIILAILIGIYLTNKITTPLLKISNEMNKIASFEIGKNETLASVFSEIEIIQNSLKTMKQGLRSFEKYVPSELVRRLIKTKREAVLGVESENVAVFFSDVVDFTTIAEAMPMTDLVEVMGEYLGAMTEIILESDGTLDKYIGDAIMAFWNAPQNIDNYDLIACKTALRCIEKLSDLQHQWEGRGLPPLKCRIGLHTGNVLVGNLGSIKRINYTVIGDTVNLASRLEGLNKQYGTYIMISEDLYLKVKDELLCRPLDLVSVKGRTNATTIYELICEKNQATDKQLKLVELYTEALSFYKIKKFAQAKEIFINLLDIFPADFASQKLLARCEGFLITPPNENWNGIYVLTEK